MLFRSARKSQRSEGAIRLVRNRFQLSCPEVSRGLTSRGSPTPPAVHGGVITATFALPFMSPADVTQWVASNEKDHFYPCRAHIYPWPGSSYRIVRRTVFRFALFCSPFRAQITQVSVHSFFIYKAGTGIQLHRSAGVRHSRDRGSQQAPRRRGALGRAHVVRGDRQFHAWALGQDIEYLSGFLDWRWG